jgi:hypothetical protein
VSPDCYERVSSNGLRTFVEMAAVVIRLHYTRWITCIHVKRVQMRADALDGGEILSGAYQ